MYKQMDRFVNNKLVTVVNALLESLDNLHRFCYLTEHIIITKVVTIIYTMWTNKSDVTYLS